jgi:pimeloyl-ACP methyl ester carboxylesterase
VRSLVVRLVVLLICVAAGACRSSPASKAVPAPAGLPPFYAVPAGAAQKSAGTLLKSEPVAAPDVAGSVHRVMYASTDAQGRPAAVSGLVFIPAGRPPAGGYPVVSWAHGTNGMAPQCAPSLNPQTAVINLTVVNTMLRQGWVVTATDYQGEGTPPGLLPYLVGDVAARNAIDIVLAARHLPSANVGRRYIVWGHSEGGHTALFAWKLAKTYGSRSGLEMVGAAAGAPPSQLSTLYQSLSTTPNRVYDYMMLAGFNAGYGNRAAPLDAVLSPTGAALRQTLRQGCLDVVASAVNAHRFDELVKVSPFDVPAWRRLFTQNDPASFTSANPVPLLIVQGSADDVVPAATSAVLADHLCSKGASLQRWVYDRQSHGGSLIVSALDTGLWMKDRFEHPTSSAQYQPSREAGVEVHTCATAAGGARR